MNGVPFNTHMTSTWIPISMSRKRPQDPGSVLKMTTSRANLRAVGWSDNGDKRSGGVSDFQKPVVTIGMPYNNSMPCNNKFLELAQIIAAEIERQGGKPHIAGTPVIRWRTFHVE